MDRAGGDGAKLMDGDGRRRPTRLRAARGNSFLTQVCDDGRMETFEIDEDIAERALTEQHARIQNRG